MKHLVRWLTYRNRWVSTIFVPLQERSHKVDPNQHRSVDPEKFQIGANGWTKYGNEETLAWETRWFTGYPSKMPKTRVLDDTAPTFLQWLDGLLDGIVWKYGTPKSIASSSFSPFNGPHPIFWISGGQHGGQLQRPAERLPGKTLRLLPDHLGRIAREVPQCLCTWANVEVWEKMRFSPEKIGISPQKSRFQQERMKKPTGDGTWNQKHEKWGLDQKNWGLRKNTIGIEVERAGTRKNREFQPHWWNGRFSCFTVDLCESDLFVYNRVEDPATHGISHQIQLCRTGFAEEIVHFPTWEINYLGNLYGIYHICNIWSYLVL